MRASWDANDDATREQALRTSTMPFIYPHVALMSDCHLGKGATVGSVIPTLGAVIPAAVGVDIGCFLGETRVPLLNGTQRSLKELAERQGPYWVYSLDDDRQVVPGLAVALRTRQAADLMKVTVSGGEEIICTPDQPFMMNDGSYREARNLRFNDSLMPAFQQRRLEGIRRSNSDPARQAQMADVGARNIQRYMAERSEHSREAAAGNGRRGAPCLAHFNTSPRCCSVCGEEMANPMRSWTRYPTPTRTWKSSCVMLPIWLRSSMSLVRS